MRAKLFAMVMAAIVAGWAGSTSAQDRAGGSNIPRELADEIQDGFIFVFDDDVPAGEVAARAEALTRRLRRREPSASPRKPPDR